MECVGVCWGCVGCVVVGRVVEVFVPGCDTQTEQPDP